MTRDVGNLIQSLIHGKTSPERPDSSAQRPKTEMTQLGVPLVEIEEGHCVIDLSHVRVFRNLHIFTRLITQDVIEQCGFGTADIMVRSKIDPNLTPELSQAGLDWVMIYARLDAAENVPFDHRYFEGCMQVIFRALQTEQWGGLLFPEFFGKVESQGKSAPPALLFPFHLHDRKDRNGHYFLVEYSRVGKFLRITVEDAIASRLHLRHIPHRVVDQQVRNSYLPNVYLIAEQIHQGILRECMNNRSEYVEMPAHRQDLFSHLHRSGLKTIQILHFMWPTDDIQMLLLERTDVEAAQSSSLTMLIKEVQLLEDQQVLARIARGDLVEMISGGYSVFFDLSRYGTCLNVSFDCRRSVQTLGDYLNRMPVLKEAAGHRCGTMNGVRLFLIHHITAEVIGLIRAFELAGCAAVTTFFVKYAGIVPDAYLETLMSLSPEYFRFYSLSKVVSRQHLAGRFTFSRQFSPPVGMAAIDEKIFSEGIDFLDAMRLAAGHVFLREVQQAQERGERMLLVEDGGYLAPLINRFCLEDRSLEAVFSEFRLKAPEGAAVRSFSDWLDGCFLGSVEHTKNGYDYNEAVQKEFGRLRFPVASIAVSSLKRGPEACECASAILNAMENVFNRLGKLFSRRTALVLGSSGAIGRFLVDQLGQRIGTSALFGVDLAADPGCKPGFMEATSLDALSRDILRRVDTIIGVVGESILEPRHIEDLLLNGQAREIFLASGSTKTVEFKAVETFLQSLRDDPEAKLAGRAVQIDFQALRDLQTGVLQGQRVTVRFPDASDKDKDVYLIGELMPVNFLYYGIPLEIIDEVMAELFRVSCGLVGRQRSAAPLPARVLAVDREIDADARLL